MANSTAWSSQARCRAATAGSLSQRIVDQRDAERRDILVTAVRIEFFQHGLRGDRPSRRRVRVSQVSLDPRIVPVCWSGSDFEFSDGLVHPADRGERHPELEMHSVVAGAHRQRAAQFGERTVVMPHGAIGRADGDLCVDG
jgi:hypothetical protein